VSRATSSCVLFYLPNPNTNRPLLIEIRCPTLLVSYQFDLAALTGRFLHITDFHPDPFYTAGGTFDSGCHRKPEKKKKKKHGKKGDKKGKFEGMKGDDDDEEEETAGRWGTSSR
jgi:hypothetical protein